MSTRERLTAIGLASVVALSGAALYANFADAKPKDDGDVKKVWVCKFVQNPNGDYELPKGGKNPIEVSKNAISTDGDVEVGDEFADAQTMSVVIQLGGKNPGFEACLDLTDPVEEETPGDDETPGTEETPGDDKTPEPEPTPDGDMGPDKTKA